MRQLRTLALLLILGAPITPCFGLSEVNDQPTAASTQVRQITLGNSTVPLDGLWKFHIGDDMVWAQPDYDDSAWGTIDLTPPAGSYDRTNGSSSYALGWTARGYKGYSGYAWYRLRVNIHDGQTALALKMPHDFDDAYQVYVNGKLIGQFGRFTSHRVTSYASLPRAFLLPANIHSGPATIAIRMWMMSQTALMDPDAGGLHGPPVLGQAASVAALLQMAWDVDNRTEYSAFLEMAVLLLALIAAFGLFWLDRSEPAYLWLGLVSIAMLAYAGLGLTGSYLPVSGTAAFLVEDAVLTSLVMGLWVVFWAYWFGLGGMPRLHRIVWTLAALLGLGMAMLRAPLYGSVVPVHAIIWLSPLTLALKLLLGLVLVWVTVRGLRQDKVEGWLALFPIVLVIVSQFRAELLFLRVPVFYFPFGFRTGLPQIGTILSLLIVVALLLRRFLHGQRERERWKTELEQARQIQSLLVPTTAPATPGFSVESIYHPASEVGGDFFHLQAGDDGSLLVVVGDVSGKGLKAAMTVSVLVGALRDYAESKPAEVLGHLNRVLHGQIKGFATCCACLIAANGTMTISNAGHIPPYLNGEAIGVPGDTPLGILSDLEYEEHRLQLRAADRLMFVSDGIVEAMNEKRELFGFERTQQISSRPAAEIASVAQAFGQQDDITVLSVEFSPVRATRPDPVVLPVPDASPA